MSDGTVVAYRESAPQTRVNFSLCLNRVEGVRCLAVLPVDRRLCDSCLLESHAPGCPSPQNDCTCGFSRLFWADVRARVTGDPPGSPWCPECHGSGYCELECTDGHRFVGPCHWCRAERPQCTRDPNTCKVDFCDFPKCLETESSVGDSPHSERGNAASTRLLATSRLIPADRRHSTVFLGKEVRRS